MSRAEEFFGAGDVDAAFHGHPTTVVPWPGAGMRKDRQTYDKSRVHEAIKDPSRPTTAFDPRTLRATQTSVTRAGVQHYLSGAAGTHADQGNPGNERPHVYSRDDGQDIILSGHHRAMTALLRGEQFHAVQVKGPWGPKR